MVKTVLKLIVPVALAVSCVQGEPHFEWNHFVMDGHRVGATPVTADNVPEALGTVVNGVYTAPNGKVFETGSLPDVAGALIESQSAMGRVKQVIGFSTEEMHTGVPESKLGNWAADVLASRTAAITGRKVDFSLLNKGGIRVSMPKGDILIDDIESMFPFKNYVCYLRLDGKEVREIFEWFLVKGVQCVNGNVNLVIRDNKIDTLLIGGEPVVPGKEYGLATIDFLLDGGDGFTCAKNAKELIICKEKIMDVMEPFIISLAAEGKPVESKLDGRIKVIETE